MSLLHVLANTLLPAVGVLGIVFSILTYRRTARGARLTEALSTVQLWEANNRALEERIEQLEAQNMAQAAQIEQLRTANDALRELVTSAAAVSKLAKTIDSNHEQILTRLDQLEGLGSR